MFTRGFPALSLEIKLVLAEFAEQVFRLHAITVDLRYRRLISPYPHEDN